MAFCLVPNILNSVNVVMILDKMRAVMNRKMAKFTHIKHIITAISIGIDKTVRFDLFPNTAQK
ncbi:hypothetical protein BKK49_04250 [Rodentibacter rarus]|nr:hypothetical protein BKK49_04250 [Rodentibacter rarus]